MNKLTFTFEVTEFSDLKFQAVLEALSEYSMSKKEATRPVQESAKPEPKPEPKQEVQKAESKPATKAKAEQKRPEEPKPDSDISISSIRALLSEKVGENREVIKAKLSTFGASNLTSLSEDAYDEFYEFLKGL